MAEGVLFTVAGEVLAKLSSHALQRLGMLCGLKDDLNKLKSNVSAIQAVLLDAERRPTKSLSLKDWLQKLGEALYDADDVLDEFSSEALRREVMTRGKNAKQVRIFFSRSNQLAFNYRMTCEVKKIRERLDVISAEKKDFHLNEIFEPMIPHDLSHQTGTKQVSHSSLNQEEVVGRDNDKILLKSRLLDMNAEDNVSFIAIVGMGGIGKTTLPKFLYNDNEVSNFFELKMWIWVSEQFDAKIVVEKMIESATGSKPNVQEMDPLQCELKKVIGGKKYLLVMDDLWNESEEKWEDLKPLLMSGAKGSKIMITKRDRKVATEIGRMTRLFPLEGLGYHSSLSLFRKVAFKEDRELAYPNLLQLEKEILDKCGGVPLVIRHIGRLLYSKTSEEEWMYFKNNKLLKVTQENNDMTSILELSYNHLPPHLKQCFAYSSLLPKQKRIKTNELIKQWIAQGFIESSNGGKSMEDKGKDYFKELCWRFFYENSSDECNLNYFVCMHDVMRELARKVAGKKLYVRGNPNDDDIGEKIHHVSLGHDIESWNDLPSKLLQTKGLRTFYKQPRNKINEVVLDKLSSNFPRLRVLNLSDSNIKIVPDSLKKLRHLRYLDLSENLHIELLPNSISELLNLQTLNLNGCRALKGLPRDTNNLLNLRHLELLDLDKLTHMPKGIGKLTCLQTLHLFALDNDKRGSKLSELNELNDLRGELYIRGLEQLRCTPSEASLANLKNKKGLRDLLLEWKPSSNECEAGDGLNDEKVLEGLEPHPNVESLSIWRYKGVGLPNWVSNSLFKLTDISIVKCNRLQDLPHLDQLPALKNLYLRDITSLQFIGKKKKNNPGSGSGSGSWVFFPSLEILILENMPNLEGWWEGESREGENERNGLLLPSFARLIKLLIFKCPKLGSMPRHPTSEKVRIEEVGAQVVSGLGPFSNLRSLILVNIEGLECLPNSLLLQENYKPFSYLKISKCPNLMSLQEWVVTSFSRIEITKCPKLKSLTKRKQLAQQHSQQTSDDSNFSSMPYVPMRWFDSIYIADCPEVEARFNEGEDWFPTAARRSSPFEKEAESKAEYGIRTKIPSIHADDDPDPSDRPYVISYDIACRYEISDDACRIV